MATIRTCDKCSTGKHDKTVEEVNVRRPGGMMIGGGDLCQRHRMELTRWFKAVDTPAENVVQIHPAAPSDHSVRV